nr:integrase, catalytic region, zinc finger, CCHC-type, peptidase aspartic, catalytic [Tanacetum cinerariifolium]
MMDDHNGHGTVDKGNDLLIGSCGMNLYSITLQDSTCPNLICLMAKATSSQAWLWHRRLSHLNFDTINLLSKNDIMTPYAYFAAEGILHQTSVARTPKQNGVVERRNRTIVEATRTMLSAAKVPLFFWAEAIATACFTQNRSLIIPHHEKTPYHIINNHKPLVKFFHIFGSTCYIVKDGENLDKMKEKGCLDTRKSTSGGKQFLGGDKLVRWSSKKQDCTSMFLAKAEHSHLVQSSPAFSYQTHRCQISLHKGTEDRFEYLVRRLSMRCLTPEEL